MPVQLLHSQCIGGVNDIETDSGMIQVYAVQYETVNGLLVYLPGDLSRSALGTFLELTDTPSSYSGQAGKIVKVKNDESGLEFGGATSGSGTENNVTFWGANNTLKDIDGIGYESNTDSLALIGNTIYGDYGETLLSRGYLDMRRQSDSYNPFFVFWRSRQTSPGGVLADDLLGRISAYGHDGSNWSSGSRVRINLRAVQDWSSTAHGTKLDVEVTPPNTTTPQKVLTIDSEGVKNEAVNKIRVKDYEVGVNEQGVENADKLDGQHGSYYLNASNINAGTLSTDRYSAYADLQAENKIGAITGRLIDADSARNTGGIKEDFTTTSPSGWAWATGTGFEIPGAIYLQNGTILRVINTSNLNNVRSFFYRTFPSGGTTNNVMAWFFTNANDLYSGLRWDDNGSNFVEVYIKYNNSTSPYYRFCGNSNGTEIELSAFNSPTVPFPFTIGINRNGSSWSSWNAQMIINGLTKTLINFTSNLSWTPTRVGFVTYWKGSNWHESYIDFIGGNGTW